MLVSSLVCQPDTLRVHHLFHCHWNFEHVRSAIEWSSLLWDADSCATILDACVFGLRSEVVLAAELAR